MTSGETIIPINIEEQMKIAYIDYSMSVIVSRALPDVRDGLKPVHRRVLYGMYELGVMSNRPYKKSARIVGEVMGKFHPHGDASIYDTMVRMAQDWSLRYPLVDGQGNFGSVDGDSPAAMRYTEARLRSIAEEMLMDIDKDTVALVPNFDDSLKEPSVLPARIPNLLINGASGIAVGMATNMAPHNISEIIEGLNAFIEKSTIAVKENTRVIQGRKIRKDELNSEITIVELMQYIKAPDFPTGGTIYGYEGVKEAFETGRGRIIVRSKFKEETVKDREQLIITEIPYQVNKSELIKRIAELVNEKKIEEISDVRDESDRDGMRIVIETKRDAIPSIVINNLYRQSELQSAFNVNNVALVDGKPKILNLKEMLQFYLEHRLEVVQLKTMFELDEAEKRAHILAGLIIALNNLDEVIKIIRESATPELANNQLISRFNLSEIQSKAILDMRLRVLTGLEIDKIMNEFEELMKLIDNLKDILAKPERRLNIVKEELKLIKDKYGDERRTEIVFSGADFRMEDVIADEEVVITISHLGYIKRTPLTEYHIQSRGGKGAKGAETRDEDFLEHLLVATNHNYLLFFTNLGKCYWMKAYEIPEGAKASKGRAVQNLLNISPQEKIMAYINVLNLSDEKYINNNFIILCTKKGVIKKTSLEAYSRPRQGGINAITIREGDELLEGRLTSGNDEILMALKSGRAIRFNESKVRPVGRNASGVRGIRITKENDEVIGLIAVSNTQSSVLVVTENGYGKRTDVEDYRITNRGGKGVKALNVTDKTGNLIAIKNVTDKDHLMIINRSGLTIRISVANLRIVGRVTQGVKLIDLRGNDSIAAVTQIDVDEAEVIGENETENTPPSTNGQSLNPSSS